jgi:hypothetical protein
MAQYKSKRRGNSNRTSRRRKQGAQSNKNAEFDAVESIVQDDEFWALGKQVMKLLAPVSETIGLLKTDGCSLGMVYASFVGLLNRPVYCEPQVLEDTATGILECSKDRWEFLHTDAIAIAFLLDPTKDPADFVDDDCSKALEQVRTMAARLNYTQERQNAAFREAGIFLNCKWDWTREQWLQQGQTAPLEWCGNNRLKYPALFELARMIFTMPTSSATAERSWSIHKYIHSKLRNQLLLNTVLKLVFVYSNRIEGDGILTIVNDHEKNGTHRRVIMRVRLTKPAVIVKLMVQLTHAWLTTASTTTVLNQLDLLVFQPGSNLKTAPFDVRFWNCCRVLSSHLQDDAGLHPS